LINAPAAGGSLPVFDRELSLSPNNSRDGGMQGYIGLNGTPTAPAVGAVTPSANPDFYALVAGQPITVTDLSKGVIASDIGINGVQLSLAPTGGTVV
jgi:hypothetical protein